MKSLKYNFDEWTALKVNGLWISFVEVFNVAPTKGLVRDGTLMRCSFTFNEMFKVVPVRITQGENGVVVRMPQRINHDPNAAKRYVDTCYAVTPDLRLMIGEVLMRCYQWAIVESGAVTVAASVEGGDE